MELDIPSYILGTTQGGSSSSVHWGDITGTLANQTDLQAVLNKHIGLEKLNTYLYRVTYSELSDAEPNSFPIGGCSSCIKDGMLYRNFDWNYDEHITFLVGTNDFTGIAIGELDEIDALPYKIVDGVNKYGIMIATHVLYNDWEWQGEGTIPLSKLPYVALTTMQSIDDIENLPLDNLCNLASLEEQEYVAQYIISDGITTYAIMPKENENIYEYVEITDNPKITNFKWIDIEEIEDRTISDLQLRPTGIERYNMLPECQMKDIVFTNAYKTNAYLSEFIGENETTKNSTDEELEELYLIAKDKYDNRQRDGQTWQTMHSVVYSPDGIQHLYVQENWNIDYISQNQSSAVHLCNIYLDSDSEAGFTLSLTAKEIENIYNNREQIRFEIRSDNSDAYEIYPIHSYMISYEDLDDSKTLSMTLFFKETTYNNNGIIINNFTFEIEIINGEFESLTASESYNVLVTLPPITTSSDIQFLTIPAGVPTPTWQTIPSASGEVF